MRDKATAVAHLRELHIIDLPQQLKGVFRIYHQHHWFSDVIAGAGFGILSTKAAYLLYPCIRNRLFKAGRNKGKNKDMLRELEKKQQKNSILLPSYNNGTVGLRFAMQF